jgi:hypothetical protein
VFPVGLPSILADNFEEGPGSIGSPWTAIAQEGDATATISTAQANTGSCAGKFTVSTSATSRAYISKDLGGSKTDVWASGSFYVATEGVANSNVAYLRIFDSGNRIADVYRQNITGNAWLRVTDAANVVDGGYDFIQLSTPVIPLNAWRQVILHIAPAGTANTTASTIQVWIDGTSVYSSTSYSLPTTHLTTVQLGNEFVAQQAVEYFDDVTIGAS